MAAVSKTPRPHRAGVLLAALCVMQWATPVLAEPSEAYVTNQLGNSLSIVDLSKMAVAGEIKIDGAPVGIAFSPDGAEAYVTAPDSKDLVFIDTQKRSIVARLPAGQGPVGVAVNPKTGAVYVAD
jgi:YVTN family beta-propeller protein